MLTELKKVADPKLLKTLTDIYFNECLKRFWSPLEGKSKSELIMATDNKIYFNLPTTVKLFCLLCDREEPFNPVYGEDIACNNEIKKGFTNQVFILVFQCQSCKEVMETFMVRRKDWKLTLMGRCPMETVQVPNYIPKTHSTFYSDAIIAFNSGQILAGLFLLRAFIEQYAMNIVSKSNSSSNKMTTADKIIDSYMELLPDDFKARFPSLKKIYSDLSGAIHRANASENLFNESIADINSHFDAKRVYQISS